jgi:hypothetical protein
MVFFAFGIWLFLFCAASAHDDRSLRSRIEAFLLSLNCQNSNHPSQTFNDPIFLGFTHGAGEEKECLT